MPEKSPFTERPPIDLSNEAVQRAQARRVAMARTPGGRNVLVGIGVALGALAVVGLLFRGSHAPPPMPTSSSSSSAAPSASSAPPSSPPAPTTYSSSPAPAGGSGATAPYVDPKSGPQSGYDLADTELEEASKLKHATVLGEPTPHVIAERMFVQTGIRLIRVTEPSRYELTGCNPVPDTEITHYASLVETELAVYPQRFIAAAGVGYVALCRDLVDVDRRRSTIGLATPGIVMLDVGEFRDEAYFRATFHRALFRVIDGREGHGADAEWAALNAPGFAYAVGNRFGDPVSAVGSGGAGFVTDTARESIDADKAETFRTLLLNNRAVEQLAASDPVTERKVALLKKRLLGRSNLMDSAFWSSTH